MLIMDRMHIYFVILLLLSHRLIHDINCEEINVEEDSKRLYEFSRVNGAGCPYTASWLVHINLFAKAHWWTESTKMEAASFNIFDKARLKFQVADPDAYYVHHMSMYEHLIHKKKGFADAQTRTLVLSKAAFQGECSNLTISKTREYLALVPFYGGLPPNVTKDLSVKSIGQGNSLVDASTKALQALATVCSCLKYFGHAVIGTVRPEDRNLIEQMLDHMNPSIKAHTHLLSLRMGKPAHLPFHLLAWGQSYVQKHNCPPPDATEEQKIEFNEKGILPASFLRHKSSSYKELYSICTIDLSKHWHGALFNVSNHRYSALHGENKRPDDNGDMAVLAASNKKKTSRGKKLSPLRFVYYTECDQVVRFDSLSTFEALSAASNDSCFFVGRRREKIEASEAGDYMGSLNNWRNCGERGYSMIWPQDKLVRFG